MVPFVKIGRNATYDNPAKNAHVQFGIGGLHESWENAGYSTKHVQQNQMTDNSGQSGYRVSGQTDRYADSKDERKIVEDRSPACCQERSDIRVEKSPYPIPQVKILDVVDAAEPEQNRRRRQCCNRQHQ
ncbi:hypothetical protein D3C74_226040 [compost metagenome]